jgi:hypothetical protein
MLHTLAKYFWYKFSPEYQQHLISPLSKESLARQETNAMSFMQKLDDHYSSSTNQHLKSEELITLISRMMCLRLIDDSSKVVLPYGDNLVSPTQLLNIITEQAIAFVHTLSEEQLPEYKEALKEGLSLLRRTQIASDYPHAYKPIEGEEVLLDAGSSLVCK